MNSYQRALRWNRRLLLIGICSLTLWQQNDHCQAEAVMEYGLVKVRPETTYQGKPSLNLRIAHNEYESFQIVCNGPMTVQRVEKFAMTGESGTYSAGLLNVYRTEYLTIAEASNYEGATGRWPDALIPSRDVFFDEQRNVFPLEVPAGENRVIWIDLFIPVAPLDGDFIGRILVHTNDPEPQELTFNVKVRGFTLPAVASLPTAFGFDAWEMLRGHYGEQGMHDHYDQLVPLSKMYVDCGLMNRITLSSCLNEDWRLYDDPIPWDAILNDWSDFFEARDLPFGLEDTRITTLELPDIADDPVAKVEFWQEFTAMFRIFDWFHLLFDYTFDEPSDQADYTEILNRAALVHAADPELRVMVTTDIQEARDYSIEAVIDVWSPLINAVYGKPASVCWDEEYEGDHRADYASLVANGAELWWYQSCMSHGCEGSDFDDPCESQYPSYMIDYSGVRNRIMSWMSYLYDIQGELYFATNYADGEGDAWENQFYFQGNGDGTLFYPGRPDRIGGTSSIPIESIRLRQIRDGLEDYEYFKLLEQLIGRDEVVNLIRQVATNAYTYSEDPQLLLGVRETLAEAIMANTSEIRVRLELTADYFSPGDYCALFANLRNLSASALTQAPLVVVLDIYGVYFYWNDWQETFDYVPVYLPIGYSRQEIIPTFIWPNTDNDMTGLRFWGAITNEDFTAIIGDYDMIEFGYGHN